MASSEQSYKPNRLHIIILVLLVVAGIILKIITAAPTWMHFDEPYYLNKSLNFIEHGNLTTYMWRPPENIMLIPGSGSGYGVLVLTVWMRVFGLSLVNGRLLMILIGLLTAIVMYFVASKWWNSREAGLAAFVFGIVSTSPFYSLIIRMDAPGMLAYSIVLLLHIYAVRGQSRWLHALTGIAAVVAVEFHSMAIIYIAMLAFYYAITYIQLFGERRRVIFDTPAVFFGIGVFCTGLVYVAIHILPYPRGYFVLFATCYDCGHDNWLFKEMVRFGRFLLLRSVEFVLLIAGMMSAIFRR